MTSWAWVGAICLLAGIAYCARHVWDLWRHRRHCTTVVREAWAGRREQTVSSSWLRTHGYGKDGDL